MRRQVEGSHKWGRAEEFTAVGTGGVSCWKTRGDFIEPALEFPVLDKKEEVFILQFLSVIA